MARPRRRNATINVKSGAAGVTVTATSRRRLRRRRGPRSANNPRGSRTVSVNVTAPGRRVRNVRRSRVVRRTQAVVRRALVRAGVTGPRPALVQRATATLGTVGANQGDNVEREGSFLLNPALTKETTGSNQFGPIQVSAASYGLWKMKSCVVKVQPLVGASAVSGTIVRISLNQTATPSQASWSALGARKHVDTTPGKPVTFTVTERDLCGPKEGWFMTNTKTDPQMCIGGSIDVHTYGKTMSAYTNTEFGGPLFILEMTATWMFASYNPESAMLNLIKGAVNTGAQGARLVAEPGEALQLVVPPNAALTRAVGPSRRSARALARATPTYPTVGEVIFSVVDATVTVATNFLPWPISWLVAGGWWFIKKVTGLDNLRAAAGEAVFNVYASIADAKNNIPVMADTAVDVALEGKEWSYQQITPGNFQGDIVEDDGGAPPTCPTLEELLDPNNPPKDWYYYPNGPPTCPKPVPGDPAFNDPEDPGKACPYWPAPLKGQPYQYMGTTKVNGFTTINSYGPQGIWLKSPRTNGNIYQRQIGPDTGLAIAVKHNGNIVPFVAQAVLECTVINAANQSFNLFVQRNVNTTRVVTPEEMTPLTVDQLPEVVSGFPNFTKWGYVLGGYSFNVTAGNQAITLCNVLWRATRTGNLSAPINSNTGNRCVFSVRQFNNFKIQDGFTIAAFDNAQANYVITEGKYYFFLYIGKQSDPYAHLGTPSWRLPLALGLPYTTATTVLWDEDNRYQFTNFGNVAGLPIQVVPIDTVDHSITGNVPTTASMDDPEMVSNPASGTNQTFSMDDLVRALNALGAEGRTDSGRNGKRPSGGRPPTPYDNIDGAHGLSPLGDDEFPDPIEEEVSDEETEESETESEASNNTWIRGEPIPCDCDYGGHPDCPYPKEEEDWGNPPDEIVDTVDGFNIALVQKITTMGVSELDAKKMVQAKTPSAAMITFKDKFHAAMYDGLDPVTARSLAFCCAMRKKSHPQCLVDDLCECLCASCKDIRKERGMPEPLIEEH